MKIVPIELKAISERAAVDAFIDHTSNVAFSLTLRKSQAMYLIDLHDHGHSGVIGHYSHFITILNGLEKRGLVRREINKKERCYKFVVSEPGKLVVQMLKLIGHVGKCKAKDQSNG